MAAISPGPPEVSNGVALALSQLADPTAAYGRNRRPELHPILCRHGLQCRQLLDNANSNLQTQQSAVAQAQNVRQQISGVSLDEEATILIQFQQAYEANSKLINILDQLTRDTINMLPST